MGSKSMEIENIVMIMPDGIQVPLDSVTAAHDSNLVCTSAGCNYKIGSVTGCSHTFTADGYWESQIQDYYDNKAHEEALARMNKGAKTTGAIISDEVRAYFKDKKGIVGSTSIIPAIVDVRIINDKVVFVEFADGTEEKAVLCKEDTFSLEQGVSICITKKMLSMVTNGNGSSFYNKLIDYALKTYAQNRKDEEEYEKKQREKKAREKKLAEKAKQRRIKKANKEREKQIAINTESIIRALKELNITSADSE